MNTKTSFFDGISYVFSHFVEYLKLFLLGCLNSLVITMVGAVPFVGWIISIVLTILNIAFVPYGVTSIVCDVPIDFKIYNNFFNFLSVGVRKAVILQIVKIVCVCILMFLLVGVMFVGSIGMLRDMYNDSTGLATILLLLSIIIFIVCLFMMVKMTVTLTLKIVASVYEDYDMEFYRERHSYYRCMFLWFYVPILNLIALYSIATVFAIDIKNYFEL